MKKFYSLLVSGIVTFSVIGSTVLISKNQNNGIESVGKSHQHFVSQNNSFVNNSVFRTLKSFTALQPLQLSYLTKKAWVLSYVKELDSYPTQKVINALKQFNTPATAVKIDLRYAGKYADEYGGYNRAGSAIRFYLAVHLASVLPNLKVWGITFNHVQLKQNTPVSVTASYGGKSIAIFVKVIG